MNPVQAQAPRGLDVSKPFKVRIFSGEEKICTVRYPTKEEFCERVRKIKAVRRSLGRDKAQFDPSNQHQVDAELFEKIRQDKDGPSYDAAEAAQVIERVERCEVVSIEREGNYYRVEMKAHRCDLVHTLRIPKAADMLEYERMMPRPTHGNRTTEFRLALEPSIYLWSKCEPQVEGYADPGNVPVWHMDAAIQEVLRQKALDEDEPDPED
jgi:hypothetical protein